MQIQIRIPRHCQDDKIRHIRVLRSLTGQGLKETKYLIDEMYSKFRHPDYNTDDRIYHNAWHTITLNDDIQTNGDLYRYIEVNFNSVRGFEEFFNYRFIQNQENYHNPFNVDRYQEWSQVLPQDTSDVVYLENLPENIDVGDACIALRKMITSIVNIEDAGEFFQTLVVAYNAATKYVNKHTSQTE